MHVSIFGLGYVGCVSAARLAESGHQVVGVDTNTDKVATINASVSPIVEPGLDKLLADVVGSGNLRATQSAADAVSETDLALICVGTPGSANGLPDVGALARVCRDIGTALKKCRKRYTVVVRSTVLPGTTENLVIPNLLQAAGSHYWPSLTVAVNPEFIREGSALKDFASPPFTVVGCAEDATADTLRSLYEDINAPFIHTGINTAEMIKYASNAFHALKICFSNEIADACEAFGVDAQRLMQIFCLDQNLNISKAYLKPGNAFGGSCLPKDLRALLCAARGSEVSLPLIDAIMPSNDRQISRAVQAVLNAGKRRVGVVGLSFKPETDDLRESPMVTLVEALIGKGTQVKVLDRNVSLSRLTGANRKYIDQEIPHIAEVLCESEQELIEHAEVIVVGYASPVAERIIERTSAVIIDLTRSYSLPPEQVPKEIESPWNVNAPAWSRPLPLPSSLSLRS